MFTLPDDPYERLGVSKDAQIPEIRQAHRKLVLRCHPDKVSDPEQKAIKQEEFQKVQRAYEMLSDSNERQKYDDMVRANEMEKQNARIRAESAAFTSRTPPRRESAAETHHYNVRMAEPRFERSSSGYAPSPKGTPVYSTSTRTPPRSYEENIYSSSYDDGREHRSSRKTGQTAYEREAPSSRRAEEEKRSSRKEADKAWNKEREKAEKDSRRRAEEKERDRREKEKEKERREKKEKAERKERKRETDEKRSRHRSPYREEEPIIVDALHKSEKSKSKANTRAKIVEPSPVREAITEDRHRAKADANLEFAAKYLQTSRSKGVPGLARSQTYHPSMNTQYAPPNVPTPPPAVGAMAPPPPPIPEEDEPVKRSSARRSSHDVSRSKLSSSHRKSSRTDDESPRTIPKMKQFSSMPTQRHSPPEVPESPPRMHRAQTDSYSRPAPGPHPGLSRAQTWYPTTPADEDYGGRSRSKHHARYHSDEDYDDYSEDERYSRRPARHHSPEASKTKFRYMVENSKAIPVRPRAESPRRGYKVPYYSHEASSGRPMASYDSYEQQAAYFPKVKYAKNYDVEDVAYSATSDAGYRMTEPPQVYGY